ncbi:MAG: UbiH/UbiF/VisC/COQ6 family ubiquinone biosynthesis hydroxylase [Pseudomonadales bacterium]
MREDTDVVIVGAGLVGLSLAAALARSPLKVIIVDSRPDSEDAQQVTKSRDGFSLRSGIAARVSSISLNSSEFLRRIGAWDRIAADRLTAFTAMHVWDGRGTSHVDFGGEDDKPMGHIVENFCIENALVEVLKEAENIDFQWQSVLSEINHIDDGYDLVFADGREIHCVLLVGADGGNSKVRELCAMRTIRWSYRQSALVTTVETVLAHDNIARQCFTKYGPLAFLPLPDKHLCSVVWSVKNVDELEALDDQEFCELLTSSFEGQAGGVLGVDKRLSFPLVQQHAMQYVNNHVALIGDAAHTIHPLAGQGANLGFADARCLSLLLAGTKLEGRSIGDIQLLKQYQRQRQLDNVVMASVMESFKRMYNTDNPAINWFRNTGMRFVNENASLKSIIAKLAGT